ncbi:hypothetical protein BU16DRAFT_66812 [Lophium mytilinum]|uniref:Uncharacterized protein n=1 Tax=Lophium mytilinum TaxID=390894 RepID=A0A6A6QPU3_9PEZI|nr:hypothetical protein BU16DRAFT_66812 [Lophium mytilinum]
MRTSTLCLCLSRAPGWRPTAKRLATHVPWPLRAREGACGLLFCNWTSLTGSCSTASTTACRTLKIHRPAREPWMKAMPSHSLSSPPLPYLGTGLFSLPGSLLFARAFLRTITRSRHPES